MRRKKGKITTKLSNITMLQMLGSLDKYIKAVEQGDYDRAESIIRKTYKNASTPYLFKKIVSNISKKQFGDINAGMRELVQNAMDSYPAKADRKVIINQETTDEGDKFICRDFGKGMDTATVIKYLLVPYNTTKEDDDTIGEHGIGWYSVLPASERVEVITGNGTTTKVSVIKDGDDPTVEIEALPEGFKGTEVTLHVDGWFSDLSGSLSKYAGFVDSDYAEIIFKGELVNTSSDGYKIAGSAVVNGEDLQIGVTPKDDSCIVYTQRGLLINDHGRVPFDDDTLHHDLFQQFQEDGAKFWIDMPLTIGLTRGRKDICASDGHLFSNAVTMAFEQAALNMLLDEKTYGIASDIIMAEYVNNILNHTFAATFVEEKEPKKATKKSAPKKMNPIKKALRKIWGKDHYVEAETTRKTKQNTGEAETAPEIKISYEGHGEFASQLMTSKFIHGMRYTDGMSEPVMVSIEDLLRAYHREELMAHGETKPNGLKVDTRLARAIISRYEIKSFEYEEEEEEKEKEGPFKINPTPTKVLKKINEKGRGGEYGAFLEAANYIEHLLSKASDMSAMPVMIDYNYTHYGKSRIACTNKNAVTYNLASDVVKDLINEIRTGSLTEKELMKIIDLQVHEKTHEVVSGNKRSHGKTFWQEKARLRRRFGMAYPHKDILGEINEIIDRFDLDNPIDAEELGKLIGKAS